MFTANGQRTEHCFPPSLLVRNQDVCLHYRACSKVSQDTFPARPFLMNLLYDLTLTPALLQQLQPSKTLQVSSSLIHVLLRNCLFCRTCNTLPGHVLRHSMSTPHPISKNSRGLSLIQKRPTKQMT